MQKWLKFKKLITARVVEEAKILELCYTAGKMTLGISFTVSARVECIHILWPSISTLRHIQEKICAIVHQESSTVILIATLFSKSPNWEQTTFISSIFIK